MDRRERIEIDVTSEGDRIDLFLARIMEEQTRNSVQRLLEQQHITVNGGKVAKNYRLRQNDIIEIDIPEPQTVDILPQNIPLDIVFEDEHLLVVNKPKGMVVHPAPGSPDGTLVNALLHHCGDSLSGIGGEIRPGIVHRIDKDTSGLLVVAKHDQAHRVLQAQIQSHSLERRYEAVVYGHLKEDSLTISAPIGRHPTHRKQMSIRPDGREAVTHIRLLKPYQGYTHIACQLETGRTHQIRVHLASINHPVAGDPVYGPRKVIHSLEGQCLHARSLGFRHPVTGEEMRFSTDLPHYFLRFLKTLRTN